LKAYLSVQLIELFNIEEDVKSFNGQYGDRVAELLLNETYDIAHYLDKEMTSIRGKLDNAKDNINDFPVQYTNDEFIEKRRELKQLLKLRTLDSKGYQKELTQLRKKVEEFDQKVTVIMDAFFENNFPMCISHGTRDQVLGIIEGKKSLVAGSVK